MTEAKKANSAASEANTAELFKLDPPCSTSDGKIEKDLYLKDIKIPYTKIALLIMLSLVGSVFGTTIYWSWNTPATHSALAAAELPGLIPVWDFYADMQAESSFKPSHNGQYFAWRATRKTKQVVMFKNQTTRQEVMRIEDVHSYFW